MTTPYVLWAFRDGKWISQGECASSAQARALKAETPGECRMQPAKWLPPVGDPSEPVLRKVEEYPFSRDRHALKWPRI